MSPRDRAKAPGRVALLAVLAVFVGCAEQPVAPRADLLVVVGSAVGGLDPSIVDRALTFDRARTPVPSELPALASLLTGRWPRNHGLLTGEDDLGEDLGTLPAAFAGAGYRTAWFVPPRWGGRPRLAQGFTEGAAVAETRDTTARLGAALAWLAADGAGFDSSDGPRAPRFAVVHVGDRLGASAVAEAVGGWIEGDGVRVAVLAGLTGAVVPNDPLRDPAVRVPLAILGLASGRSTYPASLHDLAPTLARAVGVDWRARDRATDLLGLGDDPLARLLVLEAFAPEFAVDRQAVLVDGLVLHRAPAGPDGPNYPRLFEDPAAPSASHRDLGPGAPGVVNRLERLFMVWRNGQRRLEAWRGGE